MALNKESLNTGVKTGNVYEKNNCKKILLCQFDWHLTDLVIHEDTIFLKQRVLC